MQTPNWVKLQENGSFALSNEAEAQGVVIDGTVYHVVGKEALEAHEDVLVTDVDELAYQREQKAHLQAATLPAAIVFVTLAEAQQLDDVTVNEHQDLFSDWVEGMSYPVNAIRRDPEDGNLYRCVQAHDSQAGWDPHATPAMWAQIGDPMTEYPDWRQPIGVQDSYNKGDKVADEGKRWISEVDANVWKPGVYGWVEVKGGRYR